MQVREFLFKDEDVWIRHLAGHLLRIGHEVGAGIATIELHALDDLERAFEGLGFFDGDDAVVADLLHGFGDHRADLVVAVRGDGADLGDFLRGRDLLGARLDVGDDGYDREVDAALQIHRVHPGGDGFQAFAHDRLGEHGRGRRAVARFVAGARCDFAHHLRAHVFEVVVEFEFTGDRDAVLGDARGAIGFVDQHVAALGSQGDFDGVGENVDAIQHALARIASESDVFGGHMGCSWIAMCAGMMGRRSAGGSAPMGSAEPNK